MNVNILLVFVLVMNLVQSIAIVVKGARKSKGLKEYFVYTYQKPSDFQSYTSEQQVEWQYIRISTMLVLFYMILIFLLLMLSVVYA